LIPETDETLFLQLMKKTLTILFVVLLAVTDCWAQPQAVVQEGELGFSIGAAHYFGDLNNRTAFNRPKPAMGVFFRKQFGNYVALRVGAHYAQLGYSDAYSQVEFQQKRNLSFNTDIWELAVQGDFNFFEFVPGSKDYTFTPYVTLGVGTFNYDPYAYWLGEKYYLRPLGTEGQNLPGRKPYSNQAFSFPIGMGIKYNLYRNVNLAFEISHRFTSTDYIDDVSTVYAGAAAFANLPPNSPAAFLQDRSYESGLPIGLAGTQRGFSEQKDKFIFAELAITIAFSSYRCPNPK
jgi:Domain of unknown function (DUF6089)